MGESSEDSDGPKWRGRGGGGGENAQGSEVEGDVSYFVQGSPPWQGGGGDRSRSTDREGDKGEQALDGLATSTGPGVEKRVR